MYLFAKFILLLLGSSRLFFYLFFFVSEDGFPAGIGKQSLFFEIFDLLSQLICFISCGTSQAFMFLLQLGQLFLSRLVLFHQRFIAPFELLPFCFVSCHLSQFLYFLLQSSFLFSSRSHLLLFLLIEPTEFFNLFTLHFQSKETALFEVKLIDRCHPVKTALLHGVLKAS